MLYCLSRPASFYYAGLLENGLGTRLELYRDADELCRERKSKERREGGREREGRERGRVRNRQGGGEEEEGERGERERKSKE